MDDLSISLFTYLLGLKGTIPMTVSLMAGLSPPLISPTYCSAYREEGKLQLVTSDRFIVFLSVKENLGGTAFLPFTLVANSLEDQNYMYLFQVILWLLQGSLEKLIEAMVGKEN